MKKMPIWISAAIVAALLASSLMWNYSMKAAARQGRTAKRAAATLSEKDYFDIRDKKSKDAALKLERRMEKFSSSQREQNKVVRQAMMSAKVKKAGSVPELQVSFSRLTNAPQLIEAKGKGRKFLTPPSKQPRESIARGFINDNVDLFGLSPQQVGKLRKIADTTNPKGNLSWLKLEQEWNGIKVFQGRMTAAFTSGGELARVTGNLTGGIDEQALKTSPNLSAARALVSAAAAFGVTLSENDLVAKHSSPDGRTVIFSPVGPFTNDIKLQLVYFPFDTGLATLAWSTVLWRRNPTYYTLIDADGGEILWYKNIANDQTQPATYRVYNDDSPAPLSPTTALPGSGVQGAPIERTLFTIISELPAFDNLGWLTDGVNTTTGNNVDAGLDLVEPDGIDPDGRAVGSPFRVFDFPYNPAPGIPAPGEAPQLQNYRMGAVTNLFFWSNRYHDRLYELGFTEEWGNFQQDNFGRGGSGNDPVLAQAQDFFSTNNAFFSTPPDGEPGIMEMFIFDLADPQRDGDLDQEIVLHELTHGVSNRLHLNAAGLNSLASGGMGEGWSDFYARALLSTANEDVNGLYASGAYATHQLGPLGTDNSYYGIRRFPYAVKTTVGANGRPHNPLTFADADPDQIDTTDGAFPESPLDFSFNGAEEPHNTGEIWCMSLLEVRARLITRLGFDVGNRLALQLVTDGMKMEGDILTPDMLQARDSILAADRASSGGSNELDIWAGFATRGMGERAKYNSIIAVTENFDMPNLAIGAVTITNDSCSPDGFADPGETLTLNIPLVNPYSATTLTGVTISVGGGGAVNYPDIPAEGAASMSVPFTVPADAPCGSLLPVSVVITSSVGTVTRTYNLQIGRPVITATSNYSAVNVPVQTQDGATVEIPINITDLGVVADVNARVRLNHTFDGDMTIELVGPDGTSVVLANGRGASGDNYGTGPNNCSGVPTVFDDSAPTGANVGFAPFEGVFKPEDPLSAFNGKAVAGTWKLRVTDFFLFDQGSIGCFQLEIVRQRLGCCGVPGANIQAAPPVAVVSESCLPGNGAPDPDETVTVNFPLMNLGVANTTNLVATLMPGGGVLAPSGPQSYGALVPDAPAVARPFTFIVAGMCGGDLTATLALQDGATSLGTVTFPIRIGAAVAGAATFANTAPLIIPATGGTGAGTGAPADLYPSTIEVSGVTGTVTKVTAQIFGFNHTFPGDVDILLVGPGGQKILLLSDAGGGTDAVNANMTFDDTAPEVGAAVVTGVFRPTNIGAGDLFPAPAPAGPYPDPQQLSAFNGVNPNGAWSLYVVDDAGADVGRINGGWSLTINTSDPVCCSSACALSAPANITVTADPGASGAVVNYPAPTFTGSCGVVTSDPPSGFFFPIGTTTVMVTGTRQDGTVTATSFTVTVNAADDPDDDQCGKVTGGGTIVLNGKNASFGFNARFKRPDDVQGEFEFTLHGHGRNGKKEIKSASIDTLTVDGDTGIFTGKARLNGAGNYKFTVTVVDKGEPGRHGHGNDHGPGRGGKDKFGLRVTAPNGTVVSDLTFDPTSLKGGNIQVHSAACPGHRRHGHRRGDRHDDRCDDRPGDHNGRK